MSVGPGHAASGVDVAGVIAAPPIVIGWSSVSHPVRQMYGAAGEATFVEELEVEPNVRGERRLAGAEDHGPHHQKDLVDQTGPQRVAGSRPGRCNVEPALLASHHCRHRRPEPVAA